MKGVRVIDAHMHLGAPWTLFVHGWELPDVLRLMNRLGIDRAYSIHHHWLAGRFTQARAASIKAYEESGRRIPFLAVYDPRQEKASLAAMDACLGHDGFIGIKIHPSFHGLSADDERYRVIWEYARAHRLPMISHTWSDTDNPVQKLSLPKLFEAYIDQYQDVSFVLAHSGGRSGGREQAVYLAKKYPNVYLDIAGDIFCRNLISSLVASVGADRVLFGSDQPWIDPRANLLRVYLADIDEEAKKLVFGYNALRVFEPNLIEEAP